MFFLKLNLHEFDMALGSLVWDASAMMIDEYAFCVSGLVSV